MSGGYFSVQNYIGSRLGLSAAGATNLADFFHRNIKTCSLKIYCQISVSFFQDRSLNSGLKRNCYFKVFLFSTCTLLTVRKIIGYFPY